MIALVILTIVLGTWFIVRRARRGNAPVITVMTTPTTRLRMRSARKETL